MVELHAAGFRRQKAIDPALFPQSLTTFYAAVDAPEQRGSPESDPSRYYKAALQATNDRNSRATPEKLSANLLMPQRRREWVTA